MSKPTEFVHNDASTSAAGLDKVHESHAYENAGFIEGGKIKTDEFAQDDLSGSLSAIDKAHEVYGYENVGFTEEIIAPPLASAPDLKDERTGCGVINIPELGEDIVRAAALQYVSEHCCYGKGVARDMTINAIKMISAFHYVFETFTEKRESAWKFVPYKGQFIDGPENGPAPGPWDIVVLPGVPFAYGSKFLEIPHTAFVKICAKCSGRGNITCSSCWGSGRKSCGSCGGSGRRNGERCTSCSGGYKRCFTCSGSGRVKCSTCDGAGQLKYFVQLTVTWQLHTDDYISDTSNLPQEKIRSVIGEVAFADEQYMVWPIVNSGHIGVDEASEIFVKRHKVQFVNERILKQRHCLRIVQIAEVDYSWKDKKDLFYVYGFENKVYFKKYPQWCCWCCNIL